MLADEIYERLTSQGVRAEKAQIRAFLEELKRQQESVKTKQEKQVVIERMTGAFTSLSLTAYSASR